MSTTEPTPKYRHVDYWPGLNFSELQSNNYVFYYGQNWEGLKAQGYTGWDYSGIYHSNVEVINIALQPDFTFLNWREDQKTNPNSTYQWRHAIQHVDSDDLFNATDGADVIYAAQGDDVVRGNGGNDTIVGGSGNDHLDGGDDDDVIYGDLSDVPKYTLVSYTGDSRDMPNFRYDLPTTWGVDIFLDAHGDDLLQGGKGSDTLYGGGGNDQLHGGLRGDGYTDELIGGSGSDIFYLSYKDAPTDQEEGWWSSWGAELFSGGSDGAIKDVTKKLLAPVTSEVFGSIVGGFVLGGLSAGLGEATRLGLLSLFSSTAHAKPPETGEDVMVVRDFDPRVDVLALPIEDGTTLKVSASFLTSAAVTGLQGWAATFEDGVSGNTFAEVFLDAGFLADMGLNSGTIATENLIKNLFQTSLTFDSNGVKGGGTLSPFPTDTGSYVDGNVPDGINGDIDLKAPEGTTTQLFGAFAPIIVVGPAVTTTATYVAGTDMGDLVFITQNGFAPQDWDDASVVAQLSQGSTLMGFGGDDILNGSKGQDNISGGDGDDLIYGWNADTAPSRDQLSGDAGDDELFVAKPLGGRAAADFDGGTGNDTVSFTYSRYGVTANLQTGIGTNTGDNTSGGAAYSFVNVENLVGTALNDTLTGDDAANNISGGAGDDTLAGGGGNDILAGQDGNDTLSGGDGDDTLDASNGNNVLDGGAGNDTLISGNGNDSHSGGDGNDSLTGGGGDDTLHGGAGDDTVSGGNGNDILQFSAGNDHLDGGAGFDTVDFSKLQNGVTMSLATQIVTLNPLPGVNVAGPTLVGIESVIGSAFADILTGSDSDDILNGGGGEDIFYGGAGTDTAVFDTLFADSQVFAEQDANGDAVFYVNSSRLHDIEKFQFLDRTITQFNVGDANANVLTGDAGNNQLFGLGGNDQLFGFDGNDILSGGEGDDQLSGGNGADTATYTGNLMDYTFSIGTPSNVSALVISGGSEGTDTTARDVELFQFADGTYLVRPGGSLQGLNISGTYNIPQFQFAINNSNAYLTGERADDVLLGGDGNDVLDGDAGDDTIFGGAGNDTISGGSENLIPSGWPAGNDTLNGGAGSDTVDGHAGDDVFIWDSEANGQDTYTGGDGNDTLIVNLAGATLDISQPGDLSALFSVASANAHLSISEIEEVVINNAGFITGSGNLTEAGISRNTIRVNMADGDHVADFSGLTGGVRTIIQAGDGDYVIHGGDGDDIFHGGDGNDIIVGGDGDDIMYGNAGHDVKYGGLGRDTYYGTLGDFLAGGAIGDFAHDETLVIENYTGAYAIEAKSQGKAVLKLDSNGDGVLDVDVDIEGDFSTSEIEHLDARMVDGNLRISLVGKTVTHRITDGGQNPNGGDVLYGSAMNDVLSGLGGDDIIDGNGGDDHVRGGSGDDVLRGEDGKDTIDGGSGDDFIDGGHGDDRIFGGTGNDTLEAEMGGDLVMGGDGDDLIEGGMGDDTLFGGSGDDTLKGDTDDDVITGGAGDDVLKGGSGDDLLRGGSGNDILKGGTEADILNGGADDDILKGGADDDRLVGGDGDDTLKGGTGNDVLRGGAGDDLLIGGDGRDFLHGGAGLDIFRFNNTSQSGLTGSDRDIVADIEAGDLIDVSGIDANLIESGDQAFRLDMDNSFGTGEIRQVRKGDNLLLEFNVDDDSDAEMSILLLDQGPLSDHAFEF